MSDHDYWDAQTGEPFYESEILERFNEMLDDIYGSVEIAGMQFDTARALHELDPIAHRMMFLDYIDNEVKEGALTETEPEMCDECGEVIDDGEGYDGKCGDCADAYENEEGDDE